jgi:two-component system response regulator
MEKLTREKLRILLVDDEENDAELLQYALQEAGYAYPLTHLRNGGLALEYFRFKKASASPVPHIILLDVKMPRLGGLEVLRTLREHPVFGHLPVIMLSSSAAESDVQESYRLGVFQFLRKEARYENVLEALEAFLLAEKAQHQIYAGGTD